MTDRFVIAISVFLSSPGDVQPERDAVKRAFEWLRTLQLVREKYALNLYRYEDTVPPVIGDLPQHVVNNYLLRPETCDIFICILGERMGTAFVDTDTGKPYFSGTHYEFEQAYNARLETGLPHILLYRRLATGPQQGVSEEQHRLVDAFFESFHDGTRTGFYKNIADADELEDEIKHHLLDILRREFGGTSHKESPSAHELVEDIVRRFEENNAVLRNYPQDIGNGFRIHRPETDDILCWLDDDSRKENVALLVDKPGTGKTVVMSEVLQRIEQTKAVVFAVKADYLSGIRTINELQERYQLPLSVEDSIRVVASNHRVVVLIDQLDALSISLSQDFSTLDLIHRLVLVLTGIPNVCIVISCREFDLNFDPRLSTLKRQETKQFSLAPLSQEQVTAALLSLGVENLDRISPRMRSLLTTPLHLSIFAELVRTDAESVLSEQFYSLHQLYDRLWALRISGTNIPNVAEAVFHLTEQMQTGRRLAVPNSALDSTAFQQARLYLLRVNFIQERQGTFLFFHQTLFDYSYARKFVRENRQISEFVLTSVQGLMERSIMLQVLAYLRYANPDAYVRELTVLLFEPRLHLHLRLLLIEWFASLDNVRAEERAIARRLLVKASDFALFILAAEGNVSWYQALGEVFFKLSLEDDQRSGYVVQFLSSVSAVSPIQVTQLLAPFVGKSEEWDQRVLYYLSNLENWNDSSAINMFCNVLTRQHKTYAVSHCFERLLQSNTPECCRALRVYLDKCAQEADDSLETQVEEQDESNKVHAAWRLTTQPRLSYKKFMSEYPIGAIIAAAAQAAPEAFLAHCLDWFVSVVRRYLYTGNGQIYASDAVFGFDVYTYHTPHERGGNEEITFVKALSSAMQEVAQRHPSTFRTIASALQDIDSESIQFVVIQGYLANPQEYASDICNYLLQDERRWRLSRDDYDSGCLFRAVFSHGDENARNELEERILTYIPDWERDSKYRSWGYSQTLLLKIVPRHLLSPRAEKRLQELERKFPEAEIRKPEPTQMVTVGSPISADQIERAPDNDLLNAFRVYDETTHWDAPDRAARPFGVGGIVELSRVVQAQSKDHPQRFLGLTKRFDEQIPAAYIVAILGGLASSDIDSEAVFEVARSFAHRVHGYHRMGFCRALASRARDGVPTDLISVMSEWALTDPHPPEPDPANRETDPKRLNEWLQRGINSVRGVALQSVATCHFSATPPDVGGAARFLFKALADPSPAVGACLLESLSPLLEGERENGLSIAEQLLTSKPQLLEDEFTSNGFLSWASFYYFERFGKFIEQMMTSPNEYTREEAARLACQAALNTSAAHTLRDRCLEGDASMRRGAAHVYARYLRSSAYSRECQERLLQLASDDDEEVKKRVCFSFSYLNPENDLERMRTFLVDFLPLPAIELEPRHVVEFVAPVANMEHELALDVAERTMNIILNAPNRYFYSEFDDIVSIVLATYNRSSDQALKQKAMKLFETLLSSGVHSAKTALKNWDEHRAFSVVQTTPSQ